MFDEERKYIIQRLNRDRGIYGIDPDEIEFIATDQISYINNTKRKIMKIIFRGECIGYKFIEDSPKEVTDKTQGNFEIINVTMIE